MVNGEYGMVQFAMPPPKAVVTVEEEAYQISYDAALVCEQWNALVQ
jgi:hypothetical protein